MMVYILPILGIIVCAFLFWIGSKCFDNDTMFGAIVATIVAVIIAIGSLIGTINMFCYMDYKANEPARIEMRIEERNVLNTMVGEIGTMMENDVTASSTYLTIYENVVNFNTNIREADTWADTIWEGILCDPSYAGLDVIPLN